VLGTLFREASRFPRRAPPSLSRRGVGH